MEGDVVLLCSDGFWGPLAERPMVDALYKQQISLVKKVAKLANHAAAASHPESDNVTVVALKLRETEVKLQPTDLSMSLSHKKRNLLTPPAQQVDVTKAIQDLRKFVDDLDLD
jgi:serine/threonine protein phosphatase PrpC